MFNLTEFSAISGAWMGVHAIELHLGETGSHPPLQPYAAAVKNLTVC